MVTKQMVISRIRPRLMQQLLNFLTLCLVILSMWIRIMMVLLMMPTEFSLATLHRISTIRCRWTCVIRTGISVCLVKVLAKEWADLADRRVSLYMLMVAVTTLVLLVSIMLTTDGLRRLQTADFHVYGQVQALTLT